MDLVSITLISILVLFCSCIRQIQSTIPTPVCRAEFYFLHESGLSKPRKNIKILRTYFSNSTLIDTILDVSKPTPLICDVDTYKVVNNTWYKIYRDSVYLYFSERAFNSGDTLRIPFYDKIKSRDGSKMYLWLVPQYKTNLDSDTVFVLNRLEVAHLYFEPLSKMVDYIAKYDLMYFHKEKGVVRMDVEDGHTGYVRRMVDYKKTCK